MEQKAFTVDRENYFSNLYKMRTRKRFATTTLLTGDPGIGKTYFCMRIAQKQFSLKQIEQIPFEMDEFYECLTKFKKTDLIPDEPQYALSARSWYKQLQQTLVENIESIRWRLLRVWIPIINRALIDKTVRRYIADYMIIIVDRGKGAFHKVKASQFDDREFTPHIGTIYTELPDWEHCQKPWCYDCEEFDSCKLLRGQYERKKSQTQVKRYKASSEEAKKRRVSELPISLHVSQALLIIPKLIKKGRVNKWKIVKELEVSEWRARRIKEALEANYEDEIEKCV